MGSEDTQKRRKGSLGYRQTLGREAEKDEDRKEEKERGREGERRVEIAQSRECSQKHHTKGQWVGEPSAGGSSCHQAVLSPIPELT